MASSVSVLTPNGRRQTVKCTANTTILQIIEEVCRKHGFNPEDYDIKHHNKVLDTTIAFRFSGLPNNAQLELATATKTRVDSEIILALSLEDGSRIVGNFLPDDTLWDILLQLSPSEEVLTHSPVIIYMRQEVHGEKLKETTLRCLGLRGGRAMMRLINKSVAELKTQANVSAPLPVKPVEEKPYHRTLKSELEQPKELSQVVDDGLQSQTNIKPAQRNVDVDLVKLAREREKRKLSSPTKVPEPQNKSPRSKAKEETKELMDVDVIQESKVETVESTVENNFVFLGERQAMLFSLESAHSLPAEELPDDFFELTIDDAKKILGDIRRKRQEMENGNLMTSAMRNIEESKKQLRQLHKYKQCVIRVQFMDKAILQGSFKPSETVKDVKEFVSGYLQNEHIDFYLYTTPPKSILKEEDTLLEIGCVPGALLHIGTTTESTVSLKSDLRDKFTTNSVASLAASKLRKDGTRPGSPKTFESDVESMDTANDINAAGPSSQPTSYERKVFQSTEKVPKWFKPSK